MTDDEKSTDIATWDLAHWLHLDRAFTWTFFGMFFWVLLATGFVNVEPFEWIQCPSFILGLAVMSVGLESLNRLFRGTKMERSARYSFFLALLLLYFTPFYSWWYQFPFKWLYLTNVLLAVFCFILFLGCFNVFLLFFARTLGRGMLERAAFFGLLGVLCQATLYMILLAHATVGLLQTGNHLVYELRVALHSVPWWMVLILLTPLATTITSAWYARGVSRLVTNRMMSEAKE